MAQWVKNLPAMQETWVQSPGWNARVRYDFATKPPRPQEFGGGGVEGSENSYQEQGEPASDLGQGLPFGPLWPHL